MQPTIHWMVIVVKSSMTIKNYIVVEFQAEFQAKYEVQRRDLQLLMKRHLLKKRIIDEVKRDH